MYMIKRLNVYFKMPPYKKNLFFHIQIEKRVFEKFSISYDEKIAFKFLYAINAQKRIIWKKKKVIINKSHFIHAIFSFDFLLLFKFRRYNRWNFFWKKRVNFYIKKIILKRNHSGWRTMRRRRWRTRRWSVFAKPF